MRSSTAFKGQPGKCCGTVNNKAFCCPGGYSERDAKCHDCGGSYRCFTGIASRSICGPAPQMSYRPNYHYREQGESSTMGLIVFVGIIAVFCILCMRRPQAHDYYEGAPVTYDQFGKPVMMGQPAMMPPAMPVYGGYGYGGWGMGGATTGFLGGMLVSDMMHSSHHHGVDYGGGDYSGGGGGDDGGGGGDSGFAADS